MRAAPGARYPQGPEDNRMVLTAPSAIFFFVSMPVRHTHRLSRTSGHTRETARQLTEKQPPGFKQAHSIDRFSLRLIPNGWLKRRRHGHLIIRDQSL